MGRPFFTKYLKSYDPQTGWFLQMDPFTEEGGQESLTPYQFGFNNPVRYNDPDGKCPICPAIPFLIEGGKALIAAYIAYRTAEASKPIVENIVKSIEDRNAVNKKPADQTKKENNAPSEASKRSSNKLEPDQKAQGDHSTFKRDDNGDVYKYQEWKKSKWI